MQSKAVMWQVVCRELLVPGVKELGRKRAGSGKYSRQLVLESPSAV